jgi:homogentisate phytyltransferase/homogentisate geranylgeranyltransferase
MKPAVVWSFTRPHTMYGTAIAVPAIGVLAGGNSIAALPAALCANAFVTGLNQITDVEVDRINKPFLPLPSEALDTNDAIGIVVVAAVLSILLSVHSKTLLVTTASSIALGTMYSMPPPRLKRFPLFAALSIIAVRGIIINIGF